MLITVLTTSRHTIAFKASDVAAVRQFDDIITVEFTQSHPLKGSWGVSELHAPELPPMLQPTLEGVIDFINITITEV